MSASSIVRSWPWKILSAVFTPAYRLEAAQANNDLRRQFKEAQDNLDASWSEVLSAGVWTRFSRRSTPMLWGRRDA